MDLVKKSLISCVVSSKPRLERARPSPSSCQPYRTFATILQRRARSPSSSSHQPVNSPFKLLPRPSAWHSKSKSTANRSRYTRHLAVLHEQKLLGSSRLVTPRSWWLPLEDSTTTLESRTFAQDLFLCRLLFLMRQTSCWKLVSLFFPPIDKLYQA